MEVFAKVFKRNAMWSKKKPVPDFLMSSLTIGALQKFFTFWENLDSWRVFSQYDELDPTEAQDRYERRYMEKENKKGQQKYFKLERARLIKFVEMARKHHPMIIKEEAEAGAAKELAKLDKFNEKKRYRELQTKNIRDAEEKIAAEALAKASVEGDAKAEKRMKDIAFKKQLKVLE